MIHKTEQEIIQNWDGNQSAPVLSICCTTYNHEAYISDAIESFLMQETNFPFEILIRDDCSTDKTASIVKAYAEKYPNLIKPVFEKENTFSKGVRPMPQLFKIAKGKYIALCEGDDYWTDPLKLQKQVDLLISYPKTVMSVAYTDLVEQKAEGLKYVKTFTGNDKRIQSFEEIKKYYFHTSTYVIHTDILKKVADVCSDNNIRLSDTVLRFMLIAYGPFVLLPEVVSVYRVTGKGVWTSLDESRRLQQHLSMVQKLFNILEGEYKQYQGELLFNGYKSTLKALLKKRELLHAITYIPSLLFYGLFYKIPAKLDKKKTKNKDLQ